MADSVNLHEKTFSENAPGVGGGSTGARILTEALGKAASLVLGYYATRYPKNQNRARQALACTYWTFIGAAAGGKQLDAHWLWCQKTENWEKLIQTNLGDTFMEKVSLVIPQVQATGGAKAQELMAVQVVAAIAGLKAAGEEDLFNMSWIVGRIPVFISSNFGLTTIKNAKIFESLLTDIHEVAMFRESIANTPTNAASDATAFAFEDTEHILGGTVNEQLMKDSELQSYSLNGEIIYDRWWWADLPYCEDLKVPVKNEHDIITGYLNMGSTNFPCLAEEYTVTPITGTAFNRNIVDAPPVTGSYDGETRTEVESAIRANYPFTAYYGQNSLEEYVDDKGDFLTSYTIANQTYHYVSDAGLFEPYQYVDWHETAGGDIKSNPWRGIENLGLGCASSQFYGYCSDSAYSTKEECVLEGETWTDGAYAAPWAPLPFPGMNWWSSFDQQLSDVSLRHHKLFEDIGQSEMYWQNLNLIESTGFALVPLEFTRDRLINLYGYDATNPIIDLRNLGRRAFSFETPTSEVVDCTVGPPQPFASRYNFHDWEHLKGGPFLNAQVYFENKTLHRKAQITLFPGWMYRWREPCDPYSIWHFHRTGAWNMPLSWEYEQRGWTDPVDEIVQIDFHSDRISSNYNPTDEYGVSLRPYTYDPNAVGLWKARDGFDLTKYHPHGNPSDPFNIGAEIYTPQWFFGMGDASQDFPINITPFKNAGMPCEQLTFVTTGNDFPFKGDQEFEDFIGGQGMKGVKAFYESTIIGCYGLDEGREGGDYWNHYISGYIYTGEEHAGEIISAMHLYTGYSTSSSKEVYYRWLQPDLPSYFPWSGHACSQHTCSLLSPAPSISKCVQLWPDEYGCNTTTTTATPTTSTTLDPFATTTTCDPMDPECGMGGMDPTTTTPFNDPMMGQSKFVDCCDGEGPREVWKYDCEMLECCDQSHHNNNQQAWDNGIYPEDWGWAPLYGKVRSENPPRYWRGPYASTNFTFVYPNASGALKQDHWSEYVPISGFPHKVKFDVEVEEWIAKDFISGGYVNCEGEVVWDQVIKDAVSFSENKNIDVPWHNFVDSGYIHDDYVVDDSYMPGAMGTCNFLTNDSTSGRNIERYSGTPWFDGGNQLHEYQWYAYGAPWEADDINLQIDCTTGFKNIGGFYRHTGYEFPMECLYSKPTLTTAHMEEDYSDIIKALRWGNEIAYDCDYSLYVGQDNYGENLYSDGTTLGDPIHFEPMVSASHLTGFFPTNLLNWDLDGESSHTGDLIHRRQIYGDAWYGLRSGSLFVGAGVAGNWDSPIGPHVDYLKQTTTTTLAPGATTTTTSTTATTATTPCPNPHPCNKAFELEMEEFMAVSEGMDKMTLCTTYGVDQGVSNPQNYPDDRVFLFSIRPDSINIDLRRPAYISGFDFDSSETANYNSPIWNNYLMGANKVPYGRAMTFTLTGTNLETRPQSQDEIDQEFDPVFGGANNRPIEFFKPGKMEGGIRFEATIYEKYGTLFHVPTGANNASGPVEFKNAPLSPGETTTTSTTCDPIDPECVADPRWIFGSNNDKESILEIGKRLCEEAGTTPPPVTTTPDPKKPCQFGRLMVSGIVAPWGDAPCDPEDCPRSQQNYVGSSSINANGEYVTYYGPDWNPDWTYGEDEGDGHYLAGLVNGKQKYWGPQYNNQGYWTWIEWSEVRQRWEIWAIYPEGNQPIAYSNEASDCPWGTSWTQQIDYDSSTDVSYWGTHGDVSRISGSEFPHPAPVPLTEIRVSGWKEHSKIRIKIKNIQIQDFGAIPTDAYYATQLSGNCRVTGTLQYHRQEEACIYSEGFSAVDISNDPSLETLDYPNYSSEVLWRPGIPQPSGVGDNTAYDFHRLFTVLPAPSRMQMRKDEHYICRETQQKEDYMKGGKYYNNPDQGIYLRSACMQDIGNKDPHFYNRYIWATISDMAFFNGGGGGLSWESTPRDDGLIYPKSQLLTSAAQGQPSTDEARTAIIDRKYVVVQHLAMYDSLFVNATREGFRNHWLVHLRKGQILEPKGGYLVTANTSLNDIVKQLIPAEKHGENPEEYLVDASS